ncbi:hypothetical protein ACJIZ3_024603 [Penstemon smallii]|uniref:KIB1-4 beta-propeller domain-containing protein n=1 Tax=Penstemon smallii TaxID=265156 RepID=A0ABD3TT76_9LAMI
MDMEAAGQRRQPPWLLTSHGEDNDNHAFYNVAENQLHATTIPELSKKYIYASTYGWLVLVDYSGECCIWNPESNEKVELPFLEDPLDYTNCVLSKPPTDPDCHVLFTSSFCRSFCQVGDDDYWFEEVEAGQGRLTLAVAAFKGQLYGFIGGRNQFVTVHFVYDTIEYRKIMIEKEGVRQPWRVPRLSASYKTHTEDFMMKSPCNNELLLVHRMCSTSYRYFDFKVFRLDVTRMEFEELKSIGDRTIFLSSRSTVECCSCSSSTGIKANCIYYTDLNGRDLYIYDLNDRGKTLLLPCPAASRSESMNFWIEHQVAQKLVHQHEHS